MQSSVPSTPLRPVAVSSHEMSPKQGGKALRMYRGPVTLDTSTKPPTSAVNPKLARELKRLQSVLQSPARSTSFQQSNVGQRAQ